MYRLSTSESAEATRPRARLEPRLGEVLVLGAVALDEEVAPLLRDRERVLVEVEHDVLDARLAKLGCDSPADTAVPADDVVVAQGLDRHASPSFGEHSGQDSAGDDLDERARDVEEDCHAGEQQRDGEQLSSMRRRPRVEAP